MSSLSTVLKTAGLEKIISQLEELGVETPDDIKLLGNDMIQELKINYIQKKKLDSLVEELQTSALQDDMESADNVTDNRKRTKKKLQNQQVCCNDFLMTNLPHNIILGRRASQTN